VAMRKKTRHKLGARFHLILFFIIIESTPQNLESETACTGIFAGVLSRLLTAPHPKGWAGAYSQTPSGITRKKYRGPDDCDPGIPIPLPPRGYQPTTNALWIRRHRDALARVVSVAWPENPWGAPLAPAFSSEGIQGWRLRPTAPRFHKLPDRFQGLRGIDFDFGFCRLVQNGCTVQDSISLIFCEKQY